MRLDFLTSTITWVVWAGLTANTQADQCQGQLQQAATEVQLAGGTITVTNPESITPQCIPLIFSDLFPSQACDLTQFPPASSASFAPAHLTRQASLLGISQLQGTAKLDDLAFPPALLAASVDISDIKSIAQIIEGRLSEFTDPDCTFTIPRVDNPLAQQLGDYDAVNSLRQLLASLPARKAVIWPQNVINPVGLLQREDTRNFINSLIYRHNINCILLLIADLERTVAQLLGSTQQTAAQDQGSQAVTGNHQAVNNTDTGASEQQETVIEQEAAPDIDNTDHEGNPGGEVVDAGSDGSGVEVADPEDSQSSGAETEEQKQLRLDKIEFAKYLVNTEEDLQVQTIIALKALKKQGQLPKPENFLGVNANTNLAQGSGYTARQGQAGGLSELGREKAINPIFSNIDSRSTENKGSEAGAGGDVDQNSAIRALTAALEGLNATFLQQKRVITGRVDAIQLVVDNLSRQAQNSQAQVPTQALQVQINALQNSLATYRVCCVNNKVTNGNDVASGATFYSYDNLSKLLTVLKSFLSNYRLYKSTVHNWVAGRGKRLASEPGDLAQGVQDSANNQSRVKGKKLFKQLSRSGNVFLDTLQNQLGLNEVFKALNLNSKTIKQFHPKQLAFKPVDYIKEAEQIYGVKLSKGAGGSTKSAQGDSFYSKVISSIQEKYPELQECCIVAFSALAITSLGTIVAFLACCIGVCCERSPGQCRPCCRVKNARDSCTSISPCCGVSDSNADRDAAFQPFTHAQPAPHIVTAPRQRASAQRDGTRSTAPLLHSTAPPPTGIKDWSSWKQLGAAPHADTQL